jgi:predicted DNA-binding WGR domain protein
MLFYEVEIQEPQMFITPKKDGQSGDSSLKRFKSE